MIIMNNYFPIKQKTESGYIIDTPNVLGLLGVWLWFVILGICQGN